MDAAGVIGNFERMVRIADGTGIPLDRIVDALTSGFRGELGLDDLDSRRTVNAGRFAACFQPVFRGVVSAGLRIAGWAQPDEMLTEARLGHHGSSACARGPLDLRRAPAGIKRGPSTRSAAQVEVVAVDRPSSASSLEFGTENPATGASRFSKSGHLSVPLGPGL